MGVACWCLPGEHLLPNIDTFLQQHTAPLSEWPASDVFAYLATSAFLRPVLQRLPPKHKFRNVGGKYLRSMFLHKLQEKLIADVCQEDKRAAAAMRVLLAKLQSRGTCCCLLDGYGSCCIPRAHSMLLVCLPASSSTLPPVTSEPPVISAGRCKGSFGSVLCVTHECGLLCACFWSC